MTWLDSIILAMARHGGQAHLNRIYDEAAWLRGGEKPNNYDRLIQATIEQHSSDSKCFRPGARDLFYSVLGKGEGVWGLRNRGITLGEAMSDDFVKQVFLRQPDIAEKLKQDSSYVQAFVYGKRGMKDAKGLGWELLKDIQSRCVADVAADYRPEAPPLHG